MSVNPRISLQNISNTYDNIGRLTQATSAGSVTDFEYDKAGNNLNNNALYNILNNRLNTSDIYVITYDSMGNIKSKHNKLTNTTSNYTFNSRNQLVSYAQLDESNQTTKTLSYTYDAFNRRVSKTDTSAGSATVTQKYLYDGDDIVAILDSNNAVIATITHDESIDTPLSITNANGTFYYHRDHQGSIIALTDSSGQVVESFTYDNHYGTIVDHTVTTETNNPYAYTGRELDTEELYYYRARYYDPQIERFLGEDPIGFASWDFNFYRYVRNNAINLTDPYGYFGIPGAIAGGLTGAGMSFWNPCTGRFDRVPGGWEFIRNTALGALGGFFAGLGAASETAMGIGIGLGGDAIVNLGNYSNASSPQCDKKPECE